MGDETHTFDVVIVGGGFSGAMTAAHLLRAAEGHPRSVAVVEPAADLGRGVAYGTRLPQLLLNVPVRGMSAFDEEPEHFLRWLTARGACDDPAAFVSRALFGEYTGEILAEAVTRAPAGRTFTHLRDVVTSIVPAPDRMGYVVTGETGTWRAGVVVLATGNASPPTPASVVAAGIAGDPKYAADPWSARGLDGIPADLPVLVLGTGLTMEDVVIALADAGRRGPFLALSRHGLLPRAHRPLRALPAPRWLDANELRAQRTARGLVRVFRDAVARAVQGGDDWRMVVNEVRPIAQACWRGLPAAERSRFLRHGLRLWEIHRHRAPGAVDGRIAELMSSDALRVVAGSLQSIARSGRGFSVQIRRRGTTTTETAIVGGIVNCLGPEADAAKVESPLMRSLLAGGLVRRDRLGLGIDVDDAGLVIGADGRPTPRLFTLGPLRRGALFETTAVPEIRGQARDLAARIIRG